jgi:hypothetical protein
VFGLRRHRRPMVDFDVDMQEGWHAVDLDAMNPDSR